MNVVEATQKTWKDTWYSLFDWIHEFNLEMGGLFCNVCREKKGYIVFAACRFINIKIYTFQNHTKFKGHTNLIWALHFGGKMIVVTNKTCNKVVLALFQALYCIGKEILPFSKFPSLCQLLVFVRECIIELIMIKDCVLIFCFIFQVCIEKGIT